MRQMSPYTSAFLELVDPTFYDMSNRRVRSLADWVSAGNYDIIGSVMPFFAVLKPIDEMGLSSAIGEEISRMSSASLETLLSVNRNDSLPRSSAWLFIKLYYAAFYSAHSLLRLAGRSYTHLQVRSLDAISEKANTNGQLFSSSMLSGYYAVAKVNSGSSTKTLILRKVAESSTGSHASLWIQFYGLLEVLHYNATRSSSLTQQEKMRVTALVLSMKLALKRGNLKNPNWLTNFRNNVNYRFTNDLWFPHQIRQPTIDTYYRLIDDVIHCRFERFETFVSSPQDISAALGLSAAITALNLSITDFINQRGNTKSSVSQGFGKMRSLILSSNT